MKTFRDIEIRTESIPTGLQKKANGIARKAGYHHATAMSDEIDEILYRPFGMRTYNGKFFCGCSNLKWAGKRMKDGSRAAWYEPVTVVIPKKLLV